MPKRITSAQPNLRVQIKHGIAMGPVKAQLLEAIAITGSISEAARVAAGPTYAAAMQPAA